MGLYTDSVQILNAIFDLTSLRVMLFPGLQVYFPTSFHFLLWAAIHLFTGPYKYPWGKSNGKQAILGK